MIANRIAFHTSQTFLWRLMSCGCGHYSREHVSLRTSRISGIKPCQHKCPPQHNLVIFFFIMCHLSVYLRYTYSISHEVIFPRLRACKQQHEAYLSRQRGCWGTGATDKGVLCEHQARVWPLAVLQLAGNSTSSSGYKTDKTWK